jgi:hypothetical protein
MYSYIVEFLLLLNLVKSGPSATSNLHCRNTRRHQGIQGFDLIEGQVGKGLTDGSLFARQHGGIGYGVPPMPRR